jgi:hypothetical protein
MGTDESCSGQEGAEEPVTPTSPSSGTARNLFRLNAKRVPRARVATVRFAAMTAAKTADDDHSCTAETALDRAARYGEGGGYTVPLDSLRSPDRAANDDPST